MRRVDYYRLYLEHCHKAEKLKCEINKAVAGHKPMPGILLKAIECISLVTNDRLFYDQNSELIRGEKNE